TDSKNMPPSYCLPWVEAARYSVQIKSNQEYWVRKGKENVEACAYIDGKIVNCSEVFAPMSREVPFLPKDEEEAKTRRLRLSYSPAFSSPWQAKRVHSVTLKMGICWWTPPGWGLFFTSAIHRNEEFRIVEGFVRTDLWHRDIPILVEPLVQEIKIKKYSVVASALFLHAEDIQLVSAAGDPKKMVQIANQTSLKRIDRGLYKKIVKKKEKKKTTSDSKP